MSSSQIQDQKYNLLTIADQFLTPDQLKQKRIQKMQKTAANLREEKKKALALAKETLENLKSSDNIADHMLELYVERKSLLERMDSRKKDKEDFSKRGTVQAAKRMQIIAELGKEEKLQDDEPNTFGMDDNDWNVYKDIQKNCFSEDEEDDQ